MDWRFALALLISVALHATLFSFRFSTAEPPQVVIKSRLASMEFNLVSSKPSAGEPPVPKTKLETKPAQTPAPAPAASVVAAAPEPQKEVKPTVSALNIQSPPERGTRQPTPRQGQNPPAYPVLAQYRHVEGTVLLSVEVMADGRCGDVRVKKSSGSDLLDAAALAGVKEWQFEPATRNGRPVAVKIDVPIVFKLQPSEK